MNKLKLHINVSAIFVSQISDCGCVVTTSFVSIQVDLYSVYFVWSACVNCAYFLDKHLIWNGVLFNFFFKFLFKTLNIMHGPRPVCFFNPFQPFYDWSFERTEHILVTCYTHAFFLLQEALCIDILHPSPSIYSNDIFSVTNSKIIFDKFKISPTHLNRTEKPKATDLLLPIFFHSFLFHQLHRHHHHCVFLECCFLFFHIWCEKKKFRFIVVVFSSFPSYNKRTDGDGAHAMWPHFTVDLTFVSN